MAERNVSELLNEGHSFFVPFYQRGYRWTDEEIEQLLDDLSGWKSDQGYFLQLLVVCWNNEENRYNIVDGQQRLTTISLILENLGATGFDIAYARGEKGAADERFRANARRIISEWLSRVDVDKDLLKKNILNAAFLYHKVPPEEEEAMFQQLNTWRIPATDAELVKCIVLSKGEPEIISRRAHEWDLVERSLQDNFFWGMLGIDENNQPRMEAFLHKLFLPSQNSSQKFPLFETVKTKDANAIDSWWKLFLEKWQSGRTNYGEFLRFNYTGWKNNLHNSEKRIIQFCNDSALLSDDLYYENPECVRDYLLLANAAYSWLRGERYDFYRHRRDNATSIEHIHARNQHKLSEDDLRKILPDKVKNEHWTEIWEPYSSEPDVVKAEDRLAECLSAFDIKYPKNSVDNSIGNLALLTDSENSSFGNGTFADKRDKMDNSINDNAFFPILTQAVFHRTLPCLTDNSYWSPPDRHAYRQFVNEAIYRFLEAARFTGIYDPMVVEEVLP